MADIPMIDHRLAGGEIMPRTVSGKPKFAYVDCLRGYAVLMVIICHTTYAIPQLPYPVHRLGAFGWHGVQLFFLSSCLTLLMSAHYERDRTGQLSGTDFFIRRFLRIAPMYYLAAGFYWLIDPAKDANLGQLLASLLFVNAWHPVTTTTTGAWQVVPGGWSIGVEFTFYFLFPLFISFISSFRRAALFLILMLLLGAVLDQYLMPVLSVRFGDMAADNFLYFWFFNQAPVFVLGAMGFFTIRAVERRPDWRLTGLLRRNGAAVVIFSLFLLLLVAMAPLPFSHELMLKPAIPQFLAASGAFFVFILAMSQSRSALLINPIIAGVGKVSFSAYLLHFAVIELVLNKHANFFHLGATGWTAIGVFLYSVLVVSVLTCLASAVTYALVEKPMMRLAKKLTRGPVRAAPAAA
jgi:peptidoglycan/LPS O-acetylase OafA/YrhL